MKHQTIEQVADAARLIDIPMEPMSPRQKLERWADLLEAQRDRRLSTLMETEYQSPSRRAAMRSHDSPITVAYADPILRAEGLSGESYGEARRFFELSDRQLHNVLCHCRYGATVRSGIAARAVRRVIAAQSTTSFLGGLYRSVTGWRIGD
jgi:hypothetical protein